MNLILKRTTATRSSEGRGSENVYEYELIEQDNADRYYPLDGGVSLIAVVVMCLTAFSQGLGEGLGKELGAALFGGKSTKAELKDLFESFTRFVLESIRQEFYAERWREVHEEQAALAVAFNDILVDSTRRTKDNLLALDRELFKSFVRLRGLGPGAFAGQLKIGMAVIGNSLIYASKFGGSAAYKVAVQRLDTIMEDLENSFAAMQAASKARVQGPAESEVTDMCDGGPDLPESEDEKEYLPLDASPTRGSRWYESRSKVYVVTVDREPTVFRRFDTCKKKPDRSGQAIADATAFANSASVRISNEFDELFGFPFVQARISAKQLREKAEKRGA